MSDITRKPPVAGWRMAKLKKANPIGNLLLYLYALVSIYPLIWMLFNSFKENNEIFVTNPFGVPAHIAFTKYLTAWSQYNVPRYFINSVFVSVLTVAGCVTLGLLFAYAVARMRFRFQTPLRIYMTLGLFIPVQVIMIPLAILMRDLHLANTPWALIVPYIALNLSFTTLVFYGFLRGLPNELEEAACMDGATIYRAFFSIILPLMVPAVATMTIFIFLTAWNEFTMALILVSKEQLKTLPLGLLFFQGQFTTDWGAMAAAMVTASVPTVLVYVFFSEKVESAMTVGAAVK